MSYNSLAGKSNTSEVVSATYGTNHSITGAGHWAAMTTGTGLGQSGEWWHVIQLSWTMSDIKNWISQIAIPTQVTASGIHYRTSNGALGKEITNFSWVKLLDASNYTTYCTPANIGAAASSHTHNYAGSSSAGGAASSLANFENNNSSGKNANDVTYNAHTYYTSNGPSSGAASGGAASTNDGALYAQAYSSTWVAQIAQDYRTGCMFVRGKNNGTWQAWRRNLASGYNDPIIQATTVPSANGATRIWFNTGTRQ